MTITDENSKQSKKSRKLSSLSVILVLACGLMLSAAVLMPASAASTSPVLPTVAFPPRIAATSPPIRSGGESSSDSGNFVCASHGYPTGEPACWPMGVADYGITPSNHNTYTYRSQSDEAFITINSISIGRNNCGNPCGGGEGTLSIQQNDVGNITIKGGVQQTYWPQDVLILDYYPASQSYSVIPVDNIWNFSGPFINIVDPMTAVTGNLNNQCIFSGGAPELWYCEAAPINNLHLPLTIGTRIDFYQSGGYNYITFWMEILHGSAVVYSQTYDKIEFTASKATAAPELYVEPCLPLLPQNPSTFGHCSVGTKESPIGLPYDAEWIIGGPGGGSQVYINSISAVMSEYYWNAGSSSYVPIPHAYSNGWDTAEGAGGVNMVRNGGAMTALAGSGTDNVLQGLW